MSSIFVSSIEAPDPPFAARFNHFVSPEPNTGCALWMGASTGNYGVFWLDGRNVQAHHAAFLLAHGRLPCTPVLRHRCDVGLCVAADHLIEGTQAENIADKVAKGRQARGSRNGNVKLTPEQVREIRARYAAGESPIALGNEFGVHYSSVWNIATRKTWKGAA